MIKQYVLQKREKKGVWTVNYHGGTDNAVIAKTGTVAASIDTGSGMSIASKANGDTAIPTGVRVRV